ncbi:MMPL family transporter [Streptomyces griseoloalbus]|uniref:RND superfamily putative drug exporter n=1 Tax=Streptomyces griseoloalbus TaxID=67303 RepID=A0A7W8FA56_9ACTN|nr:MMPL family transporter [Streptomyces albaduncus]MBB5128883.1 RND superfamily putative drug exporter [Streptomyces albaduncus]GGW43147.1 putative membrane protein [Streptomyces albaduncus]
MFGRVGRSAVKHPWLTILAWVIAAVGVASLAPPLEPVSDQAEFLPSHYESVQAGELQKKAFPQQEQPASVIVFRRDDNGRLTDTDLADVKKVAAGLEKADLEKISAVETGPQAVSANGEIALASILATTENPYDETLIESVGEMREQAVPLLKGTDLHMGITGSAATALDTKESSGDTDAMIMMATLVLLIVLLAAIFRSPLIAILPVLVIALVFVLATGMISIASEAGGFQADASIGSILIVVLFGVGTDYLLFLLFRYRELLRNGQAPKEAMTEAVTRVGETIASAAGAVIVAFLALLLSSLGMLKALGPALAISVGVTLIASLTLVPAVFSLLGTKAFWPSKAWRKEPKHTLAARTGSLTARRPGLVAAVSGGLLAVLATGVFSFNTVFDSSSSLPKDLESVQAAKELERGFAAGQTDPTWVFLEAKDGGKLDQGQIDAYGEKLTAADFGRVTPPVLAPKGDIAKFGVVLTHKPDSDRAVELLAGPLRDAAHDAAPDGTRALVGGTSAVLADIQHATNRDYSVVFPAAGLAIMVILGLLLRSVVAPLYLMVAVGLGFAATLGATVWVFQNLAGEAGLPFTLPVIVYLFVVAIGTDYNILMVARLREEVGRGSTPAQAVRQAITHSTSTIGTAAVILAGTFGVLLLAQNSMLRQMGFAVAFGILLTAFAMAVLLVPAVTTLLGHRTWWPGRVRPEPAPQAGPEPAAGEPVGAHRT